MRKPAAVTLVIVAASCLLPRAPAVACCPPERVAEHRWTCADANCDCNVLAADDVGGVYTLAGGTTGPLRLLASHDDGDSFTESAVPLDSGQGCLHARLAASAAGDLVVASRALDGSAIHAAVSHDQGRTFEPRVTLASGPPGTLSTCEVTMSRAGVVVVSLFRDAGSDVSVWAVASQDAGRSWSAGARVSDPGGVFDWVTMGIAGSDVVASWIDAAADGLIVDVSHDGGRTWSADRLIAPVRCATSYMPAVHVGAGAGAFQVLHAADTSTGSPSVVASRDGGRTWLTPSEPLAATSISSALLALTNGFVAAAWTDEQVAGEGVTYIAVSRDHGVPGSFGAPDRLLGNVTSPEELHLAEGVGGRTWLLQGDYRDDPGCAAGPCESVYVSKACKPGNFEIPPTFRLDDDGPGNFRHSEAPLMVAVPSGRVHVLWHDIDGWGTGGSERRHVALAPRRGDVVPASEIAGPLMVARSPAGVRLAWPDALAEATSYDVMRGTIASLHVARTYDHAGDPCSVPRQPPGAATTSLDAPMPSGDAYWLVAAATCAGTGPLGWSSFAPIPPIGSGEACDQP